MEFAQTSYKPWFVVGILILLVVIAALGVIYSTFQTRKLVAEFQHLQNVRNQLQVERGQLLLEQSTWGSFNRVEQLAGKKLKMHVPDPEHIVMVSQ